MHALATTLLDVLGLLLLAGAAVTGVGLVALWLGLLAGGIVVLGGSQLIVWIASRPR